MSAGRSQGITAFGEHAYDHHPATGVCRVCGFTEDDGRAEHLDPLTP